MTTRNHKHIFLSVVLLPTLLLVGCSTEQTLSPHHGEYMRAIEEAQSLNPGAPELTPVAEIDGAAGEKVAKAYAESFSKTKPGESNALKGALLSFQGN